MSAETGSVVVRDALIELRFKHLRRLLSFDEATALKAALEEALREYKANAKAVLAK